MGRHRITVSFDEEAYRQLKNTSDKEKISLSEAVRRYVKAGLNGSLAAENLDYISKIIREQTHI